ncbi:MAG: TIGR03617 family F420-dependent LLM class oxidoreductase [Chloroflexota bacterium]|nr:MAG: TIGR03617 family F420-dependent LLM class oxidoreductase [Chloroflexota bacterium]
MLLDAGLPPAPLQSVPSIAREAEALGFNALWSTETIHNPFMPGALVAEHTNRINFGTAVAVSFARSPTTMAYAAWDLAQASKGRFILGLGTQVSAHIERRFGMPWPDSPVGKLREQIAAMRALWNTWQTGAKLNFRGEYYRLTLMSPFFNPGPIDHPEIPIYIAGVNTGMARLAGEVADGFLAHPFHSPRYLSEVIRPAIGRGAQRNNRELEEISLSATVFVITNAEEKEFTRQQIAFYASTPSYRPVLALYGWEGEGEKLSALVARGKWGEIPKIINDEMLEEFAVISTEEELAEALKERYWNIADRITIYLPFMPGERDAFWKALIEAWRED